MFYLLIRFLGLGFLNFDFRNKEKQNKQLYLSFSLSFKFFSLNNQGCEGARSTTLGCSPYLISEIVRWNMSSWLLVPFFYFSPTVVVFVLLLNSVCVYIYIYVKKIYWWIEFLSMGCKPNKYNCALFLIFNFETTECLENSHTLLLFFLLLSYSRLLVLD